MTAPKPHFDPSLCPNCQKKPAAPEHDCPYELDVEGVPPGEQSCRCCKECEAHCADDI